MSKSSQQQPVRKRALGFVPIGGPALTGSTLDSETAQVLYLNGGSLLLSSTLRAAEYLEHFTLENILEGFSRGELKAAVYGEWGRVVE